MALDPVPWAVGGGAEHGPEVARLLGYVASGGAEGIVTPGDFKVTAQSTPGGTVRVAPGAAAILNRYGGGSQQSYMARAATLTDIAVAATGSSGGRTDMVILAINDPQYGGDQPPDPAVGPYVRLEVLQGVAAGATSVPAGITYPAIPLARITIPSNTTAITGAMITDVRRLARPRRERVVLHKQSTGTVSTDAVDGLTSNTFVTWPSEATWTVEIPTWATTAIIRADVSNYIVKFGNTNGQMYPRLGSGIPTARGSWDENFDGPYRSDVSAVGLISIPPGERGTTQTVSPMARRTTGSGVTDADQFTVTFLDIEFQEAPA